MEIRKTRMEELDRLMDIYANARAFMARTGNPHQWGDGNYPDRALIESDIAAGHSYVLVEDEEILATYFLAEGPDPCYSVMLEGAWLDEEPYVVIHRIASSGTRRGAASHCIEQAVRQYGNLRIDTHDDNLPMQRALERLGFTRCGRIPFEDGTRITYHRHDR